MKYSRKIPPGIPFDFYAYEAWLEDLAEEGFFPVSFNAYRVKFRQDIPQKMKYRIEIPKYFDTTPPKILLEERKQQGWTFVTPYYQKGFLWCSAEENAVEFIDATTQAENIHSYYKSTRNLYLICFFLLLFMQVLKQLLHYRIPTFSIDSFFFFWLLWLMVWEGYSLYAAMAVRKELCTTDFSKHRRDYRKGIKWQKINLLLYPIFIISWILFIFWNFLPF